MKNILLILSIIISGACSSQTTNEKIVSFVESKVGKKVGSGICHDLVAKALNKYSKIDEYKYGHKGMYGTMIDSSQVIPGDIIVFHKCKFEVTYKNILNEDTTMILKIPGHVGVVMSVDGNNEFTIADQNSMGTATKDTYVVVKPGYGSNNLIAGKVLFFRPL